MSDEHGQPQPGQPQYEPPAQGPSPYDPPPAAPSPYDPPAAHEPPPYWPPAPAPHAQPEYHQPQQQPQYQPPEQPYQQPQYQPPEQPYQQPQYQQPTYQQPEYPPAAPPQQPQYPPANSQAPSQQPQYQPPQFGQQQYGQPQYGQQQYGQPQYGQVTPGTYGAPATNAYPSAASSRGVGRFGGFCVVVGGALVAVAFTAAHWFGSDASGPFAGSNSSTSFSQIHTGIQQLQHEVSGTNAVAKSAFSFGISPEYFSWLGWTLLAVAVVAALIGVIPSGVSALARFVGVLVALAGAAATFWAVGVVTAGSTLPASFSSEIPSYTTWLSHASYGFYLAVAGFLLIAVGALAGPSRRRASAHR